ncbi:hypothetical protein Pelo_18615 [Pelomyxa schiedti]|nr:hypothetical protein Pelo_18615 [Pelomyxa schiedti]
MQGWGVQRRTSTGPRAVVTTVYEGEWDRGQWHGSGTWWSPDGSGGIYHGTFDHGKRTGQGRMLFGDNSQGGGSYVGEWNDDMFRGRGVRLWANGDRYEGQWVCGKENGQGTKTWSIGWSSFTGLWDVGVPKKGTRRWPNGDQFEGTFKPQGGLGDGWACCGEGTLTLAGVGKLRGTLNGNTFKTSTSSIAQQHEMGSSQSENLQRIEALKKNHIQEKNQLEAAWQSEMTKMQQEWERKYTGQIDLLAEIFRKLQETMEQQHDQLQKQAAEAGDQLFSPTKKETAVCATPVAYNELNEAFKLTTHLRRQLRQSAPEFIILAESVDKLNQSLQGSTQHNEKLTSHLSDLGTLKATLGKELQEFDESCKEHLGQTLTVQNSEAEMHECSRKISVLTSKLLSIKTGGAPECTLSQPQEETGNSESLLKVGNVLQEQTLDDVVSTTAAILQPFSTLTSLTETLTHIQGCQFEECTKLADQHIALSKELAEKVTLSRKLHKAIAEMQEECSQMKREHKSKMMLIHVLEGDEQFIGSPNVFSQLCKLLPQAQQAVTGLMASKAASLSALVSTPSSTLPGCTSSATLSSAGVTAAPTATIVNKLCIECDERQPNVLFQPCGHVVLCSQASRRFLFHCSIHN